MNILGLAGYCHDSAAVLIRDGVIVAAAQEERFSRRRHDPGYPAQAAAYCLAEADLAPDDIHLVATHGTWDAPTDWSRLFPNAQVCAVPHHLAHAASAFFPSPFSDALVLVLDDGLADHGSTLALGKGGRLTVVETRPDSLAAFYTTVTEHLGFKPHSAEYKVMGLAPYGTPRFATALLEALPETDSGWFTCDRCDLSALVPMRQAEQPLTQDHLDLAASLQYATETVVLRLTRTLARRYPQSALCLAGALALNCVINGRLARDGAFRQLWVQPAAGDAGGALGAALVAAAGGRRSAPDGDTMRGSLLGPSFPQAEIERRLAGVGARFTVLPETDLLRRTAAAIAEGRAVGWFQGRMEFGPRALGARSILADPRSPTTQRSLNQRVKFRESFRPFAPAVCEEAAAQWFDLTTISPYMLSVIPVRAEQRRVVAPEPVGLPRLDVVRSSIPAVTHVDYSARVQTVSSQDHPRFHALLSEFGRQTGCPVLVNTSFNVRGEPIVCTPEDAFRCFMGTDIEMLVVGDCLLVKEDQDQSLRIEYRSSIELD